MNNCQILRKTMHCSALEALLRTRIIFILFFLSLLILKPIWAANNHVNNDYNNYWQCVAQDKEKKQWVGKNGYERVAANKAFEMCKKESSVPTSCKAANESCDYFVAGKSYHSHRMSNGSVWQCTALDQRAKAWIGNTRSNRDDAALGAKAYCQEHSTVPDSCYINLLTCKRVNSRT